MFYEVQGLVKEHQAYDTIRIIETFLTYMSAVDLRVGVGLGALSTDLRPVAIGMDGEAWYNAKKAIDEARRKKYSIQFAGFGPHYDLMLSSFTNLLFTIRSGWTEDQKETIKLLEQGNSQVEISRLLQISKAAVSKRVSSANWREYRNALNALNLLMRQAIENNRSIVKKIKYS